VKKVRTWSLSILATLILAAAPLSAEPPELRDEPVIDFEVQTLAGDTVRPSDLQGKVVLLNFWGVWCVPCRQELPKLQAMYEELRGQGLEIVGLDVGDEPEAMAKFVGKLGITYPVAPGDDVATDYDVEVFPTNVIIDRAGRIRHVEEGYAGDETSALLRTIIEQLLKLKPQQTGSES
jgi:thiol-disulfide isomerase/thioredoxin